MEATVGSTFRGLGARSYPSDQENPVPLSGAPSRHIQILASHACLRLS